MAVKFDPILGKVRQSDTGTPGQGVPVGGTTGQVLAKIDNTDYNDIWINPPAGTEYDPVFMAAEAHLFAAGDKSKLDGIAAGAEVNINADWNSIAGDSQILNKPTVPTALSQLNDDATHRIVTDTEKGTWNGKQDAGSYVTTAQTMYVGTTSHAINRGSASEALTGITSIDGSAAKLTTARNIGGRSFDGSADIVADTWKNGIATKNTADASTTQNIAHGLGRVPSFVRLEGHLIVSAAQSQKVTGCYNGTTNSGSAICFVEGTSTASTDFVYTSTTQAIGFTNAGATSPFGGAASQTGVVTFDATNIIITWTKTGTITGTANILWECT